MSSIWIERTYEPILLTPAEALKLFSVWLLLGPRQVGKSSLLLRCAGTDRQVINLDDLAVRTRAAHDPVLFAANLRPPLLLDEIQYAPALLSAVKRFADTQPAPGAIWLTGSQRFDVMQGTPDGRALPRLDRMAEPSWQPGRVLSLTALGMETPAAVLADGWMAASPLDLSFLDHGRR